MPYHVHTAVFEGPLDLLLQLISRRQVDVTAVNLTELVGEYLVVLDEMQRLDLDVTSEFILIAATLIQLKAHRLLPAGTEVDIDEELALIEERDLLLLRLLSCATFKDVAAVFLRRLQEAGHLVPRTVGVDQELRLPLPDPIIATDAAGLARIANTVLRRPEPELDHIDLDLPSVEQAMVDLRSRLAEEIESTFDELVTHCLRPMEVAAYFLALLELARWGLLELTQEDWLSPITVRATEGGR
jgi:segregation and condensation protein A